MVRYFFPKSAFEREWADTSPARFTGRLFFKFSATMALVLAVFEVVWPQSFVNWTAAGRLGFIVLWSAIMAAINLWAARHTKRVH